MAETSLKTRSRPLTSLEPSPESGHVPPLQAGESLSLPPLPVAYSLTCRLSRAAEMSLEFERASPHPQPSILKSLLMPPRLPASMDRAERKQTLVPVLPQQQA